MLPPSPIVYLKQLRIKLEPALAYDFCGIGIDPGQVNMGMAFVYHDSADLYQIKLPSNYDTVDRIKATATIVAHVLAFQPGPRGDWLAFRAKQSHCVVEGAAFGAPNGQVALAENRATAVIQTMMDYIPVAILPPGEIKQRIFGKGNLRAGEAWPSLRIPDEIDKVLRDDAAAALSCAFYAYVLKRNEAKLTE